MPSIYVNVLSVGSPALSPFHANRYTDGARFPGRERSGKKTQEPHRRGEVPCGKNDYSQYIEVLFPTWSKVTFFEVLDIIFNCPENRSPGLLILVYDLLGYE